MKQNSLRSLSFSLILLFSFSCKKEKGALYDLPPGRFDFVCIWDKDGVQDTATGEVSGPYSQSEYYYFNVKQELGTINYLKDFQVGHYSKMTNEVFYSNGLLINAKISSEEHNSDYLLVHFQNDNPTFGALVSGTFKLTRKE